MWGLPCAILEIVEKLQPPFTVAPTPKTHPPMIAIWISGYALRGRARSGIHSTSKPFTSQTHRTSLKKLRKIWAVLDGRTSATAATVQIPKRWAGNPSTKASGSERKSRFMRMSP